jgi:diguanylate cyclase (GGDEF)-like protein
VITSERPVDQPDFLNQWQALYDEGQRLLELKSQAARAAAESCVALAERMNGARQKAQSALLLGQVLMQAAELKLALDAATTGRQLSAELRDETGQAEAETLAGKINLNLGAFGAAEQLLRCALSRVQDHSGAHEQAVYATALNHLAGVQFNQGAAAEALLTLETALRTWRALGQPLGQANCLTNLGSIQNALGQYHAAVQSLGQAYELHRSEARDLRSEAFILNSLAQVHSFNKDHTLAVEVSRSALMAAEASQDQVLIAITQVNLGTYCLEVDLYEVAGMHLHSAMTRSRAAGYRTGELSSLDSLGLLYQKTGHLAKAREAHQSALELALDLGDPQGELEARLHLSGVAMTLGDLEAAQLQAEQCLSLTAGGDSPKEELEARRLLALLAAQRGEFQLAFEHGQEHLRIKDELFNVERDRQTRNLTLQFEVERARHDAEVYRVRTEMEQQARMTAEKLVQERTGELARAQHEVVTRLAMAAEYRDDTTGEHTRRVGRSAAQIARALGWPEDRARLLGIAARLHDVGKIGIPDSILLKADKLDSVEFEQMKTHTLIGARILSGGRSELLRLAEEIALTHHERWDGSGYPLGLREAQIPMTGRIVALADVFDALTQSRPYKRAWTAQEALSELKKASGTHFDPVIVQTALQVLNAGAAPDRDLDAATMTDQVLMDEDDASHILEVFEQLLVERTRDLETARQQAEEAREDMARMAYTDSLTALPNRRAFETDLEAAFQSEARPQLPSLAVITFDLDGLKLTNDTMGHDQGDALLRAFGQALQQTFSQLGGAYRIGGDEFAVLARRAPEDPDIARLLQDTLDLARSSGTPQLSASMGVARFPGDAQTPGDLQRISDRRMYQDKLGRRANR